MLFPINVRLMAHCWSQKAKNVDAIVVFTGGAHRLCVARSLYQDAPLKKMHISGVGWKKQCPMHRQISWDGAKNTWENIVLTGQWMRRENVRSIQLVTSDYHMFRCLLLAKFLWKDITINPYVVNSRDDQSPSLFFSEYNKCCSSFFLLLLRQIFA